MTDKILNWWRSLPWYWKIPAVLVLAIAVITCLVELFSGLFTKRPPDPGVEFAKAQIRSLNYRHEQLKKNISESDRRYQAARDRLEKTKSEVSGYEDTIRDCDNVACVDDILRKRDKSRD